MAGKLLESENDLEIVIQSLKSVAVIGIKDQSQSNLPAFQIPKMVADRGYNVIPVNPKLETWEGRKAFHSFSNISVRVDVVNLFRRAEFVEGHVDEILSSPKEFWPKRVWMQTGIRNEPAANKLMQAGIDVVMDKCLGVYVSRYGKPSGS